VLLGDAHARVRATIGGYSETGLDNVVDGSTYLRPQGVSSGHQLTYHGLYGDTSGDTTTAIVDGANKRFVHGAMSTPTQAVITSGSQITSGTTLSASGTAMSTIDLSAATGTQRNLVPDSDLKSVNGYWGANGTDTPLSWGSPVGAPGGAGFYRLGTGAPFSTYGSQVSRVFNVVPGLTYTFSAYLDATNVTGGAPLWKVCKPNNSGDIAVLTWAAGENARKSISFVMPSGVTQAEVMAADVECTVTLNTEVQFSNPQLEVGSVATAYRPNIADDLAGGLLYSGVADDNAKGWNRLANVASDNTGVTLGYSGKVQMVVGSGFFSPSTGGYIPKRTLFTAPTGTEANGTVISFANLTDQAGNALPTFDVPPLVALHPYNMTSPPSLLYASGMTTTGFTLNSYSGGTTSNGSAVNLPNGTTENVTATSGDTITSVTYTVTVTAKVITPTQNFSQSVGCYLNGTSLGNITINGQTGGHTYSGSLSAPVSGNPTSVTAEATWTTVSDVSSISAIATPLQISGETAVSANVTCSITEPWSA
jgi:hypothetical protein